MPPKKKGNKKGGQDDWEAEMGESVAPADSQAAANGEDGAENEEDDEAEGGLMAMLRKRKERRKQKGLPEEAQAEVETADGPSLQTAQDATMEDEFALPDKKGKGGKGKQGGAAAAKNAAADDVDDSGRVLTKAEKEKLKKEREKQRKKEQVRESPSSLFITPTSICKCFQLTKSTL